MSWNYARFASSLLIFHMINVHFMKYHKRSKAFKNQLREPQRSSSLRSGGSQRGCAFFRFFEVPGLKGLVILAVLSKSAIKILFCLPKRRKTMENSAFSKRKQGLNHWPISAPVWCASSCLLGVDGHMMGARDSRIYHRNNWTIGLTNIHKIS